MRVAVDQAGQDDGAPAIDDLVARIGCKLLGAGRDLAVFDSEHAWFDADGVDVDEDGVGKHDAHGVTQCFLAMAEMPFVSTLVIPWSRAHRRFAVRTRAAASGPSCSTVQRKPVPKTIDHQSSTERRIWWSFAAATSALGTPPSRM